MRKWIIGVSLLLFLGALWWFFRPKPLPVGDAYIGEPATIVWSTTAPVRQTVTELHWGDHIEILSRSGNMSRVRTMTGTTGWIESHSLLDGATWDHEARLITDARSMPIQSPGHTKVFTNVRLDPGRDAPRIYQLPGGVPVSILGRAVADAAPVPGKDTGDAPKREDWLLISAPAPPAAKDAASAPDTAGGSRQANQALLVTGNDPQQQAASTGAATGQAIPHLSGWVLGRFIELDLPETLHDYATSAGMHPVAWFVLNRVSTPDGDRPQYLVAGNRGGEGSACDFTLLRVYTWGAARQRYETAYVESDFCGFFPLRVGKLPGTGDPEFRFSALTMKEPRQERIYEMRLTTIRRIRTAATPAPKTQTKPAAKLAPKPPAKIAPKSAPKPAHKIQPRHR